MGKVIEFYFDVGSTNSYFALFGLPRVQASTGARVEYLPINLGYLFRSNHYVLAEEPAAKLRHRRRDLERWASWMNLPFRMPARFPIKTSRALRGCLAMARWDQQEAYIHEIFRAYWERGEIIEDYEALVPLVTKLGVDGDRFVEISESDEVRTEMIEIHDRAVTRGVFGAPTFFVGDEMFWGKDRLDFVERELLSH